MARLREEDIKRVQQNADITEVIGQYIPVEKKGRNFVALCPFHDDNNPSLSISPDKQIYKCFVCGAGGNVFTFVSKYNNVSFVQSVIDVAKIANIDLDVKISDYKPKVSEELLNYYKIMSDATAYWNFKLINNQEQFIADYLKKRNINESVINHFNVGYESDNSIIEFLSKKGYSNAEMEKINLINIGEYGTFSVFNNRLLFPIHNQDGYVVGYSGRLIVDDANQAKYINSNENAIYTKGDILYNLHRVRNESQKPKEVYLVEGVMDVIGFYEAGLTNVVATLGTALTSNQIRLLKGLSNHVVLSYDGDAAGKIATLKAIDTLLKAKINIEVLVGFKDLDPDEYLKVYDTDKFIEATSERISFMDFILRYYQKRYNLDNYEERKQFSEKLVNYLQHINNDFDRSYFLEQIEKLTNFSQSQILKLRQRKSQSKVQTVKSKPKRVQIRNRSELALIGQMLAAKEAAFYIRDNLGFLVDENLNSLYLIIVDYYFKNDNLELADLISVVSQNDLNLAELLLSIINNNNIIKAYDKDVIDESITLIRVRLIDEKIKQLKNSKEFDDNKKAEILKEITKLSLQKSELLRK